MGEQVSPGKASFASRMVIAALIVAVLAGSTLAAAPASAAPPAKTVEYEYFLLIDTSGSMMGLGPGNPKKIFPKVQAAVSDFIGSLDLGRSSVYLYPFDSGVGKVSSVRLSSDADKGKMQRIVRGLKADGSTTAIYDSLGKVVTDARRIRTAKPDVIHVQTILLFTDGKDTSTKTSLKEILKRYRLERGENPYLYLKYVTLGTTAAGEWKNTEGVTVQEFANANDLPALQSVRVRPTSLDFGSLRETGNSKRAIEITFDPELAGSTIGFELESESAESEGALVSVEPRTITLKGAKDESGALVMRTEVALALDNKDSLDPDTSYTGTMRFQTQDKGALVAFSPPEIPVGFSVSEAAEVEISASDDRFGGSLGELDPYAQAGAVTVEIPVRALFNNRAADLQSYVTVRVRPEGDSAENLVTLVAADGTEGAELKLTPDTSGFTVRTIVQPGAPMGDHSYSLQFEPSDAELTGLPSSDGIARVPLSFSVPAKPTPPPPLWRVVLNWLMWIVLASILIAGVAFVALCVISGTSPGVMLGLFAAKMRPVLKDARFELVEPAGLAEQISATGKRRLEFGSGSGFLEAVPIRLVLRHDVRILEGREHATLGLADASDGSTYFSVLPSGDESGLAQPTTSAPIFDGDRIEILDAEGKRSLISFMSADYRR